MASPLAKQALEKANWEAMEVTKRQFPDICLEDKAFLDGGGNNRDLEPLSHIEKQVSLSNDNGPSRLSVEQIKM